jgi:hypothetical protein
MAGIYRSPVLTGVMLTGVMLTGVMLTGFVLEGALTAGASAGPASARGCPAGQITGSAATPTGAGYWLVDSGGDVFSFGDARFAGSVGGKPQSKSPGKPVVAIVPTRSGNGYWEVAADGAVFAFGDAVSPAGDRLAGTKLKAPIVAAARVGANGLELAAADGAVFPLGGAPAFGSMGGKALSKPITSVSTTPAGDGYWLAGASGGVFAFGGSAFLGNALTSLSCATPAPSASGSVIVQYATNIITGRPEPGWSGGPVPYSWGGGHGGTPGPSAGTCAKDSGYSGPKPCQASSTVGVDCSGFARWVYSLAYGSDVLGGGNTDSELSMMTKVNTPQPGDLAFFGHHDAHGYHTHHVGIYLGNDNMIDAYQTGTYVQIDTVGKASDLVGYWRFGN